MERNTAGMIESLILYLVLFLPGAIPPELPELIAFSMNQELSRIMVYDVPSLALIWYLVARTKDQWDWRLVKPRFLDILSLIMALPGLMLIGFCVSVLSSLGDTAGISTLVEAPQGLGPWLVTVVSCISTGYLEESYFRFYLLQRLEDGRWRGALGPSLLFSLSHLYEGPWGMLNAALAGLLLSFIFMKKHSLHGLAWAHGLYNVFVYAIGI
ncbi:MAG: CPBP family intramembrane metalloprotease [Treponema sp.]|nr:CPBP family intramembrane metalloprotease [Treponema sp.]